MSSVKNVKSTNLVILFAFNRIEMLHDRLEELRQIAPSNLLVSIDFLDLETSTIMSSICNQFSQNWPDNSKFNFKVKSSNLGLAQHLAGTISESLKNFESVIVIEDDISISEGFYNSALKTLARADFDEKFLTFGGYSPLALPKSLQMFNTLRSSPYFSSWGWAISREGWEGYKIDIVNEDIVESLDHSRTWNRLSKKQKRTWIGRFRKIQQNPIHTWDIQLQFHLFKCGKENIVPIGRLVENIGFGDSRSSHTKSARPKWMGNYRYSRAEVSQLMAPKLISRLLTILESLTVVGDNSLPAVIRKLLKII